MKRKIVHIDREKCTGCGLCVSACHEGAIAMEDGRAVLLRDDYCDGLGDCLPACPADAITIEEREAVSYDEGAVAEHLRERAAAGAPHPHGCPGSRMKILKPMHAAEPPAAVPAGEPAGSPVSALTQWPVQIRLVPSTAPFFRGAGLLVAADCTAYAFAGFHERFMRGRVTLIGCPKLDPVQYGEKLTEILTLNDIRSVAVVRMEVPCCGGIEAAVRQALPASGKSIPWSVTVISTDGRIADFS